MPKGSKRKLSLETGILDKVVNKAIKGATQREIGKSTKASAASINKVLRSPELMEEAKRRFTARLLPLIPLVIECIEENLKKGNINAVYPVMNHFGAAKYEEEEKANSQTLTVVFPGASVGKTIEVSNETHQPSGTESDPDLRGDETDSV